MSCDKHSLYQPVQTISSVSITMSEHEVHLPVAQWIIIKFLTCEDIKPSEILHILQAQFLHDSLKKSQVYEWYKLFKPGWEREEGDFKSILYIPSQSFYRECCLLLSGFG